MRISEGRRSLQIISSVLVLTVLPICFARGVYQWKRLSQNPVVAPQGQSWGSAGTFNPAIVQVGGRLRMLYRAQDVQVCRAAVQRVVAGEGLPLPSTSVKIVSTAGFSKTSVKPLGQRISIQSILLAVPRPKCTRRSLLEI